MNCPNMPYCTKVETLMDREFTEELTIDKQVSVEGHFVNEFRELRRRDGLDEA